MTEKSLRDATAPNFSQRWRVGRAETQVCLAKRKESSYHHELGHYIQTDFALIPHTHKFGGENLPNWERNCPESCPLTFESYLRKTTQKLLKLTPPGKRVVLLDIGGGVGLSWSKTALEFSREIREGKLVMVISNLVYNRERVLKERGVNTRPGSFFDQANGLVHYVTGRFSQLKRVQVSLPGGESLALRGHVDLVHEMFSLTFWSRTPELDILQVASLLSDRGSYFVSQTNAENPQRYYHDEPPGVDSLPERKSGIALAQQTLQTTYGLRRVTEVEAGEKKGQPLGYFCFKKPQAPLIEI